MAKPKILVADPLPAESVAKLQKSADVEVALKLPPEELKARIKNVSGLVVRSESKITREILDSAGNLRVIARAGVGVDNIDVEAATQKGIIVLNSPEGNTLAAAEHTIAMMLALARKIPQANQSMKQGAWNRHAFTGVELFEKKLGIVGVGHVGREVAARAKAFHMEVLGYDPYVNENYARELGIRFLSLEELLNESDFVSLHLILKPETQRFMNAQRFSQMKKGSFFINCARGALVDEKALYNALTAGPLAGAALDVFADEPPQNSPLLKLDNVVATPHLGASTQEAQARVAVDVVEQILEVLDGKPARTPVNIPTLSPEKLKFLEPFLSLSQAMSRLLSQLVQSPITRVQFIYQGEIGKENPALLTAAGLRGLLEQELGESVNAVNAAFLARNRGIQVEESRTLSSPNYTSLISLKIKTQNKKEYSIAGSVFQNQEGHVVEIGGYAVNLIPKGCKLLTWHQDRPGMVGHVGIILGENDINIAEMQLGRDQIRGQAVMVLSIDDKIPPDVLKKIKALDGIQEARLVVL